MANIKGNHIAIGKLGENLAENWLRKNNFTILHRNWKYQNLEVDIIASKKGVLHFIEVKTRRSLKFGNPEEGVSRKKLIHIIEAANEYQFQHPEWHRIQFDVLSITLSGDKEEYFFIEDIYI